MIQVATKNIVEAISTQREIDDSLNKFVQNERSVAAIMPPFKHGTGEEAANSLFVIRRFDIC